MFPVKTLLRIGWDFWLRGMPGNEVADESGMLVSAPVRPFRLLDPKFLPSKQLKSIYKVQWKPVFSMMEEGIEMALLEKQSHLAATGEIEAMFQKGVDYLKSRASYIWRLERSKPETWVLSNWSKRLLQSATEKDGTPEDKAALPPAKKTNRSHPSFSRTVVHPRKKRMKKHDTREDKPVRQQLTSQEMPATGVSTAEVPNGDNFFDLVDSDDELEGVSTMGDGKAVLCKVNGANPNEPGKEGDDILRCNVEALRRQGMMVQGCIVRGYLSALV
jgi:hypothetical protein